MESMRTHSQELPVANKSRRHELGQFLTSNHVSDFMACLFCLQCETLELLDAGAGAGYLTAAGVIRRICQSPARPQRISVTAYEIDLLILAQLNDTMADCKHWCKQAGISFAADIRHEDFIFATIPHLRGDFLASPVKQYNGAIVNPPYKKIRSNSPERLLLSSAGIETCNLYTAFIAIIIRLLKPDGELVAITPRSFCNGPYFKPFRLDLLRTMGMRQLHVFESRSSAFKEDNVLQENIIFHAAKGEQGRKKVILSTSSGDPGSAVAKYSTDYHNIVSPHDPEKYIHRSMAQSGNPEASCAGP